MQTFSKKQKNHGYTLVETMVSITIFLVAITAGIGALLNVHYLSNKSRDMRSIMDNLSFIMEEMSRNLRTGYNFHCELNGNPLSNISAPQDRPIGYAIAFEEANGDPSTDSDQWVYRIQGSPLRISKSIDGGSTFVDLNAPEIRISSNSGFAVLGALPPNPPHNDKNQPMALIRLSGEILYHGESTPFTLETTATQRLIDVGL